MTDTDTNTIASRYRPPGAAVRGLMVLIALGGLGLSAYLAYVGVQKGVPVPGCGPGSGCSEVLDTEWSVVLGIPTAFPAVVVYLATLGALLHIGAAAPAGRQRGAWMLLILAAMMLFAAAVWFSYLQYFVIGAFCKYCMGAHGCGVVLASLILFNAPIGRRRLLPDEPNDPLMVAPAGALGLILVALLGVGAMAVVQVSVQPPPMTIKQVVGNTPLPPDTDEVTWIRMATREGGIADVAVPRGQYPTLGPADAPVTLVYLFDYTCTHCRDLHGVLREMRNQFGDSLAIMALPAPLNSGCNPHIPINQPRHLESCELARIALRVWQADPMKYPAIDNWLFAPEEPRTAADARSYARRLLGVDTWERVAQSTWPEHVFDRGSTIYGLSDANSLPILKVRDYIGQGHDRDVLRQFLTEQTGQQPSPR